MEQLRIPDHYASRQVERLIRFMRLLHVAAAVLNQTPLDWEGNRHRILQAIDAARAAGASVVCLPELCITGYGCEDAFLSPGVQAEARELLLEILPATRGLVVALGLPLYYRGAVYNAACLAVDGAIAGFAAKRNLAGEGIHYEPRWFKPWPEGVRVDLPWGESSVPLGDLMFDVGGVSLGFEICEDAWVADRPGAKLSRRGCDVILNPSASHFAFGKHEIRRRFVLEGSRAFGVGYVYANLLGNEAGRALYDGDAMIASCGSLCAAGRRFSYADTQCVSAVLDLETIRLQRTKSAAFRPILEDDRSLREAVDFTWPSEVKAPSPPIADAWERSEAIKEEEFTRAVALGLFDYLRKSRSRGFVVSLSGGADSAAVALSSAQGFAYCEAELGYSGLREKLAYLPAAQESRSARELTGKILTTVYQSTANSGEVTLRAARETAAAIGARFLAWDVDAIVKQYVALAPQAWGRQLDWKTDDIALQNIQARVRSPSVWLLANVEGALLLSTSNRSEAAVGYATMDGDTSGGLAPIAGIDKAFLRQWLRWREKHCPLGEHSLAALSYVNVQAPTAELRPAGSHQTDEADLMPYDVLDAVERAAIRDKKLPLDAWQTIMPYFPQHSSAQLAAWVERFFRLWSRNQWKRERYAPSFHFDDENLDPKTWCRFPILSGGFEREIARLRAEVSGKASGTSHG